LEVFVDEHVCLTLHTLEPEFLTRMRTQFSDRELALLSLAVTLVAADA
jgi:hypothetical protein